MRSAKIDLEFGDGTYTFRLGWKEIISLQEKLDIGPYMLQQRLLTGEWRVQDIGETIRWGLLGGGMQAPEANRLVRSFVESNPVLEDADKSAAALVGSRLNNWGIALAVINAALVGAPEEGKLGEAGGERETKANGSTTSPTENGASPLSSDSPPLSAAPTASS